MIEMTEISRFNFSGHYTDDILLMPAMIEKLNQLKEIIQITVNNLYNSLNGRENATDLTVYTRQACKIPA